jgi:two-component system nitrate/nitrite response regulator NarL
MERQPIPLNVLIADDHRLFRQGLVGLMSTRPDLVRVVGEASTGSEALALTEHYRPDVVLLDISMPDGDGLCTAAQIRQRMPDVHIVMLTASESDEHLFEAVRLGVSGYLLKSLDAAELFDILAGVSHGEPALSRAMAARLLKGMTRHDGSAPPELVNLTERELEVLRLVAHGSSNPEIAGVLCISVNTVKVHLRNLLHKLQLDNRTQVATYAVQSGLCGEMVGGK